MTATTENFSFKYLYATDIAGDPALNTSHGTVGIDVREDEVDLDIPDRFGHSTSYNFSTADWFQILEMLNAATLYPIKAAPPEFETVAKCLGWVVETMTNTDGSDVVTVLTHAGDRNAGCIEIQRGTATLYTDSRQHGRCSSEGADDTAHIFEWLYEYRPVAGKPFPSTFVRFTSDDLK